MMIAIVPILPFLFPIMTLLGWSAISIATVLGLAGTSEPRRKILRFLWKQKYSLLVIFAVPSLAWYGVTQWVANLSRVPGVPIAVQSGIDWPMFRGGPDRTGTIAGESVELTGEPRWSGGLQESFFASPTVVGNRVYGIGSSGDVGRIFCWHTQTGELQWVHRPDELRATFSSPVVVGDRLVCGEGLHLTANSRVFCLDLSDSRQPKLHWSFTTASHVECTPVVVNGRVYVAAGDDGVYALSLQAERDGRPALLWHLSGDRLPDAETALVADSKSVYVGTGEGGNALVVLDATSGKETARIPFKYPLHAPPALVGQRLYVGMGSGNLVTAPSQGGGAVVCIDTATSHVTWIFQTPATVLGAITVSQGEILFGCADGVVRSLSLEGQLIHSWDSGASIVASLAVMPETLCGVNVHGRLFVLDRQSWTMKWDRSLGREGYFISSPAIASGRIYVGTEKYGLQCFGRGL
jgi:outer membrane protein assembly factor BamB